jgi:hypothetical protein
VISRRRHLSLVAGLAACAIALAGCGGIGNHANATEAGADNNGAYITVGNMTYQLQVSRQLNQYEIEDHQYLTGLPTGTAHPTAGQFWYGVFLWAQNRSNEPQTTSDRFVIVDTQGNKYYPLQLNSTINQYAWTGRKLWPQETEPGADTTASHGATGGALILFKLGTAVYANRPLTLQIYQPGVAKPSTISLDL